MRAHFMVGLLLGLTVGACASDDEQAPTNSAHKRDAGSREDAGSNMDAGPADSGTDAHVEVVRDADQDAEMPMISCDVEAPHACVEPKPVYDDVSPIFKERCVLCHNGAAGGPWPLTSYGHVADWQNEIRDQVSHCTMPPVDASVPITTQEREKILMWIRCGMQR